MLDVTVDSAFSFTAVNKSESYTCNHENKGSLDLEGNRCIHVYEHSFSLVQTRYDRYKSFPIKCPRACIHAHVVLLPLKLRIYLCYVIITTSVESIFIIIFIITSSLYEL